MAIELNAGCASLFRQLVGCGKSSTRVVFGPQNETISNYRNRLFYIIMSSRMKNEKEVIIQLNDPAPSLGPVNKGEISPNNNDITFAVLAKRIMRMVQQLHDLSMVDTVLFIYL